MGEDVTVLQFGRLQEARDRFVLDFGFPLSPMHAFGICLASLDRKIADSKSFDTLRKLGGRGART